MAAPLPATTARNRKTYIFKEVHVYDA